MILCFVILLFRIYKGIFKISSLRLCFATGLHRRAGVEGSVSRGGRRGGAARQVEPPGGEEFRQARGGHAEGRGVGAET